MSKFARPFRVSARSIIFLAALALPLVVSIAYLRAGARTPSGAPMLPLDDSYIHLQYAWQASRGQFLQYNPGEPATSGATSLLYMLLVALGFLAGIGHEAMPAAVLGLGVGLFVISSVTLASLARRAGRLLELDENLLAAAAIIMFAGSGWMAWAFLSGMETGLLIMLVFVALWAATVRRIRLMALACALAALTRPEAALLPLALLIGEVVYAEPGQPRPPCSALWLAAALSAAGVSPAVNYVYTGSFTASGTLAKSLFTMVPFQWSSIWAAFSASLLEMWARLFGGPTSDGHWQVFPLLQLFGVAGAVLLARQPAGRRLALACVLWTVFGTLASATLQTALWHHYRYQMPVYPAVLVLGAAGLVSLAARWLRGPWALWLVTLAPLAVWSAYSIQDFRAVYARDSQTAAGMQLAMADWLAGRTPASARVAVHDGGIVRYFSGRATVDVVGLTTADMALAYRNGPGSLYEALEHTQPGYYAVYPNVAPPFFGLASAADLLGQELFRVRLVDYSATTSAGDTQVITQPDWSTTGLADAPQQPSTRAIIAGLTLTDALDVGDLQDEQRHSYVWWNIGEPAGFPTDARVQSYRQAPSIRLADGGRVLNGGESFALTVKPGEPLTLVARLHQTADMVLEVNVNGADLGGWRLPAVPGQWLESAFRVGRDYLQSSTAHVRLTVQDTPPGSRYSPFDYWAYQGPPAASPPAPQHPLSATFGSLAELVGYDASAAILAPGDNLTVTLDWQALTPDRGHYQVFVHIIDPANDTLEGILAQMDEAPRAGTYPIWVWSPGEMVGEPLTLAIPAQAKPGEYWLLAGLYNADSGDRLPFSGAADFGSRRVVLGKIEVRR